MFDTSLMTGSIHDSAAASRTEDASRRMERLSKAGEKTFSDMLKTAVTEKDAAAKRREEKRLREACYDMESIFVSKMLKEMRKTVHKNEWTHGGYAEEIFEDMLYDEYSKDVSRNGKLGLADMLYREMSRNL